MVKSEKIFRGPLVARAFTYLGEKGARLCNRVVNRFGPENMLKPRDVETLCELIGNDPRALYFKTDPDGVLKIVSPSTKLVFGIDPELIRQNRIPFWAGIPTEKGRMRAEEQFKANLPRGAMWGRPTKFGDTGGKTHFIETNLQVVKDGKGRPRATVGIAFDITKLMRSIEEQENAVAKLNQTLSELRSVQDELTQVLGAHESILKIFEMISQRRSLDDILQNVVDVAASMLGVDASGIKLINVEKKLEGRARAFLSEKWAGPTGKKLEETLSGQAFTDGSIIAVSDIRKFGSTADPEYVSGLYAGLKVDLGDKTRPIGVIVMYSKEKGFFTSGEKKIFTDDEIEASRPLKLIKLFVRLASAAVSNAELATLDELTQLYSFRIVTEALHSYIHTAIRSRTPVSLLVADIDNFKVPNDLFGNHQCNRLIQMFAQELRRGSFGSDILGRHGGDEFIDILPSTPAEKALVAATKMQNNIAALRAYIMADVPQEKLEEAKKKGLIHFGMQEGMHVIGMTASIGGVTLPSDFILRLTKSEVIWSNIDEIVTRIAEEMLNQAFILSKRAKEEGRNRIRIDDGTSLYKILNEFNL